MKRSSLSLILILTAALALFPACGEKKIPEQVGERSKSVLTVLQEMTAAYEAKDIKAFMANVAGSYQGREGLEKALGGVFAKYATINFTIHYAKMIILIEHRGLIKPTFTWDAEWISSDGSAMKDGGRITLGFEPNDFKLKTIDGRNPFLAQPTEAPAGKQ